MAKQVVDRDRSSRIVGAAVTRHSTAIGAAMGDALAPYLQRGEVMPDFALFLTLAGRLATDRSATLVRSSAAHEAEASDDAEPRARRDASEGVVRQLHRDRVARVGHPNALRAASPCGSPRSMHR